MNKYGLGRGTCVLFLLWAGAAVALPAQTFTTLHNFNKRAGSAPLGGLIQGSNGDFYGTTKYGGVSKHMFCTRGGCGIVFEMAPAGKLTVLHNFCSESTCQDGNEPIAGLVQGADGKYYGTTSVPFGDGTVFSITADGALTTLYTFDGSNGAPPDSPLVQRAGGKFYGTSSGRGDFGDGTVSSITAAGALETLSSFDGTNGAVPYGGLIQGMDGNFYGTTETGGTMNDGTVFSMTPGGALTTLYSFCSKSNCKDGSGPKGGLVQGADGNFYGTTFNGGRSKCANGCGTIFKISPAGQLTTLYSFCSLDGCTDGGAPQAGLVQGTDGNFYGTTTASGGVCSATAMKCGTIFRITPGGVLTALHNFDFADGANPTAALIQGTDGNFYGTTSQGGVSADCGAGGCGTIFSLSVGLGPFVETVPASGKVGAAIRILGTNLQGATSVTFNGTPAIFIVKSKSEITTNVPSGATTGTLLVVTPSGTLASNVSFRVTS
jgi:uncharacterized repeat protein (TIGR03803 family)